MLYEKNRKKIIIKSWNLYNVRNEDSRKYLCNSIEKNRSYTPGGGLNLTIFIVTLAKVTERVASR